MCRRSGNSLERERKAEEVPEALKRKREIGWSGEE